MSFRVCLSPLIYDGNSLMDAISAYSGICRVELLKLRPPGMEGRFMRGQEMGQATREGNEVRITAEPGIDNEARAVREFLNYLLDASLEARLKELQGG